MPRRTAASMYCLACSVVAPWRSPGAQVHSPTNIAHQMPMNFSVLTQLKSDAGGSLRAYMMRLVVSSMAESAIIMSRHGVLNGSVTCALVPSDNGVISVESALRAFNLTVIEP